MWQTVQTVSSDWLKSTVTISTVEKGETYVFRFNTYNAVGWSGYSPETSVLAAEKPAQPKAPQWTAADSTPQIVLALDTSVDDGGSPVTGYTLEKADGVSGTVWTSVASYTSGATTATVVSSDGIVDGGIYKFRFFATNDQDDSIYSDEVVVSSSNLPDASGVTITKDSTTGSKTSITVVWSDLTDGTAPGGTVLGYILTAKDLATGESWEAFNGQDAGMPD